MDGALHASRSGRGPRHPGASASSIFEPFFTTREQGTGLGLPLARKIARAHGGELLHQPDPERTRFVLTLPLAPA